jgi:uncharacterized protein (DUF924 family)
MYASDDDFLAAFEAGAIPPAHFGHREHLRVAFLHVRRLGEEKAAPRVLDAIRRFATRAGKAHIFDEPMTRRWLARVAASSRRLALVEDFASFLARAPELRVPDFETVLRFWFPRGLDADEPTHRAQVVRWFRGGTDAEIVARFADLPERAARGELDPWASSPRGRLALILVCDQFSRSVYRGSARAFAFDEQARALADEGIARGHYDTLAVWEKIFASLPFGHSETLADVERAVTCAEALIDEAPPSLRGLYEMSAGQARARRDEVAKFGRIPGRNEILGRESTPEEKAHLANLQRPSL